MAGILGANVLRGFRLEIHFPGQLTYREPGPPLGSGDLEMVPFSVRAEPDGSCSVAGAVSRGGAPLVEGLQADDAVIRIGELVAAGAPMGAVVDSLWGEPGATRILELERGGRRFTITAKVARLP